MLLDTASAILEYSGYGVEKKSRVRDKLSVIRGHKVPRFEMTTVWRDGFRHGDYEKFASLEDLMTASFASDIDDAAADAARLFDALTVGGNIAALPAALDAFEATMRSALTNNTERLVKETLERLTDKGAMVAGLEQGLRDTIAKNDVIDNLYESAKFYTNDHFSRNVLPRIYKQLDDIYGLNLAPTATLKEIREYAMSTISKAEPNLRITANGAASKSYHYGVVKGGWDAGFRTYEYVAIRDDRTSEICLEMNGKQFFIADAVNVVERRTEGSPDQVRENAPWFNMSSGDKHDEKSILNRDGTKKDVQELSRMGCLIPPLHANCRSSIQLL